jgi:IS30 family transposase
MSHSQFTRDDRVALAQLLWAGKKQSAIAKRLGKNPGAVSREISRNKDDDGIYRSASANRKAKGRRVDAKVTSQKIRNDEPLRHYITRKIEHYWSPEQIAGRLKHIEKRTVVSHETIYQFIYEDRPDLKQYLRYQKGKYRRKRGTQARGMLREAMKIRKIEERPRVVAERSRIGDWEGDTIIDRTKKQRILTHVERKSGFGMADKVATVTALNVHAIVRDRFKKIPKKKRYTMTRDNGVEFGDYDQLLEEAINMKIYRATPYHSWERGTNENWNGLFRQFYPKKSSFATVKQSDIEHTVRLLNDRPRKRLGYRTPQEMFNGRCNSS